MRASDDIFSSQEPVGDRKTPDRIVRSVCSPNCMGTCGVNVFVKDDRILKIEPASYPDPGFERICLKGIAMAMERVHHPKRLRTPMIRAGERGEGKWREVGWDEAYDYIIERMTQVGERHGLRSNAWLTMTGNYAVRANTSQARAANCLSGSIFDKACLMGDMAGPMATYTTLGSVISSNEVADIVNSKYMLFVGRNTADTGHSEMHFVFDAIEQGAKLVVVDPRFSRTAAKADEWLAVRPGSDVVLAMGMLNVIITDGLMKADYVRDHTNGPFLIRTDGGAMLRESDLFDGGGDSYVVWDEAAGAAVPVDRAISPGLTGSHELIDNGGRSIRCRTAFDALWDVWRKYTPEYAEAICGVPAEQIRRAATEYATVEPAWLYAALGVSRYRGGHTAFRAYIALCAICGNIGKKFAGFNYLDGPHVRMVMNVSDQWTSPTGRPTHHLPGTRLIEAIVEGDPYPVRSLWIDNYGFATQSPLFKRFKEEALPQLDLYVVSEQLMTDAAEYADVVLPVVSYYEDDWDLVAGGEIQFMQLRRRAIPPVGESRNDYEIYKGLCEKLGKGEYWQMSLEESARFILETHNDPSIRAVDWDILKRDGVARVPRPGSTGIDAGGSAATGSGKGSNGRSERYVPFADLKFSTPSGRIELYQEQFLDIGEAVIDYVEPSEGVNSPEHHKYPLNFISYKHVHSAHSQHTILPGILELLPEPTLEMHPDDGAFRGIISGEEVVVFNERGMFRVRVRLVESVAPGVVAMPQGWWKHAFKEGHPSDLGHLKESPYQKQAFAETSYSIFDLAVDVRPARDLAHGRDEMSETGN